MKNGFAESVYIYICTCVCMYVVCVYMGKCLQYVYMCICTCLRTPPGNYWSDICQGIFQDDPFPFFPQVWLPTSREPHSGGTIEPHKCGSHVSAGRITGRQENVNKDLY